MNIEIIDAESRVSKNFEIPPLADRESIPRGVFAKVIFVSSTRNERMWVEVDSLSDGEYTGRLANVPLFTDLKQNDVIRFRANNVIELKQPWAKPPL